MNYALKLWDKSTDLLGEGMPCRDIITEPHAV